MTKWTTACPDWRERIVKCQSILPLDPIYKETADIAWAFFSRLRLVTVPGRPTFGDLARPWLKDFVRVVFGALDPNGRQRDIKEILLLVPKKNGKTTLSAAIKLTELYMSVRESALSICMGPTIEVATLAFRTAADMVRVDPILSKIFKIQDHTKTITDRETKSQVKIISADRMSAGGTMASHLLFDELHLLGQMKGGESIFLEASGGLAARPEGLILSITTQSDSAPAGIFAKKLAFARKVRDGEIHAPWFLPVLYEYPENMIENEGYKDRKTWKIVNPNLDSSVSSDYINNLFSQSDAVEHGGTTRQLVLAAHLNIEISSKLRRSRWCAASDWAICAEKTITLDRIIEECEVIIVGIDGGGKADLFGLAVLGRQRDTGLWMAWTHAWCHEWVVDHYTKVSTRLRDFSDDGDLTIISDMSIDIREIVDIIHRIKLKGLLCGVAIDPMAVGDLVESLGSIGISEESKLLFGIGQGYRLTTAIKMTERRLSRRRLVHHGSRMMEWCVSNLIIIETSTAIKVTKESSGDEKVDPMIALFNAVMLMGRFPTANTSDKDMNDAFEWFKEQYSDV